MLLACELLSSVGADWSEPLMKMAEHASQACELFYSLWADQSHWQELLNTHLASEPLSCVWADQSHWWEWLNTHLASEFLSSVWADQNHWWDSWNGWTQFSLWVSLSVWTEPLMRMTEHNLDCELLSSVWVEPLMKMTKHVSSLWVAL